MSEIKKTTKIKKTDISITIILLIGILVVVNFFSYKLFLRFDLTKNNIYSISQASKKTVRSLDDIIMIKAYFSKTLPNQLISLKQEVADLLSEYETYSKGKVRVEFIDPGDDEDVVRELMILGIPQLTFEVYEKDKLQLVNGYMGLAVSFADNTEAIPAIKRNTSDLEYQITTAIKKVTTDEIATIGYLITQETSDPETEVSIAYQELAGLYTINPVSLAEEEPEIPVNINTLVIIGPKGVFNEDQLKAINGFMLRGGSLLVLADGVTIGEGLMAVKNPTGLETLLTKYGLKINQDLVADERNGLASFTQGFMRFSTNYSFWPKITNEGFNKENAAVSNLENVIFPWVSSVSVDTGLIAEGQFDNLAFTTEKGWRVTDNFSIDPKSAGIPQGDQKSYAMAVSVNAPLRDAYPESEETRGIFDGRLIVVGDSDFISDNFIRNTPDNLIFFQNLVDLLSFDEDLINIRSKSVTSRPIKADLSDSAKAALRYLNVFGITLIVVIFGVGRYFIRRRSRFVDDI